MFKEARVKLTAYYLAIIMAISMFFSLIIYQGATSELRRIENMQMLRRPGTVFFIDPDIVKETKYRIFITLLSLNAVILAVSGLAGYFLAGKTLEPIAKNLEEQKEFVSNASHELRTPLASLKSEIEVFLRDKRASLKDAKEVLESNLEDVNNMTRLSNYLLKLNKFQNGTTKTDFKKLNLADIVKKVVGKDKIKLDLSDTFILGDEDSISELLVILIDNAKKYSKAKSQINVSVINKTLTVSDKGIGISESDLPHIFERFYRGNKARGKDGYGLGLSIAKQITNTHNAKIKVESKVGIGSTFKVIFS